MKEKIATTTWLPRKDQVEMVTKFKDDRNTNTFKTFFNNKNHFKIEIVITINATLIKVANPGSLPPFCTNRQKLWREIKQSSVLL